MAAPSVLFASSTEDYNPDEFVKQILNVPELPPSCCVTKNVCAYNWHVDTKYYTTDVHLCTTHERTIGDQTFAEAVEAFVIHFDPKQVESFKLVKAWLPYLEQIDPEIQILACENCSHDDTVSRLTAQTWCIENSFELVELSPLDDDDDDDVENDFPETTGIKRIIQALHAHSWPNLKLKENPDICSPYFKQLMQEEALEMKKEENKTEEILCEDEKTTTLSETTIQDSTTEIDCDWGELQTAKTDNPNGLPENTKDNSNELQKRKKDNCCCEPCVEKENSCVCVHNGEKKELTTKTLDKKSKTSEISTEEKIDGLLPTDDMSLFAALGNEDLGSESFEELFHQLSTMKDTASKLPADERKIYAEKIAIKFWKAIGGDEDEIAGLSDDDDDASQTS
ncbi:alpha- and gamma-adaptin-binding protein p34-like [Gigantopelta aegis]|uniref:alpha- and gamma-adaptin-binding protein p34-like n=1 Tax=Gigantopelta aegis TaxID=1735272 RepID=UPI001B88B41A|nr:alpha- and gamma-adaptin-binding protein p34-like [Gigantopelta aegis]